MRIAIPGVTFLVGIDPAATSLITSRYLGEDTQASLVSSAFTAKPSMAELSRGGDINGGVNIFGQNLAQAIQDGLLF
jgi:hypothetical protein